ncbi:MAG: TetR/AcrR family transcriptional regulator [Flavobacteriales bacterium]
MKYGIRSVTMDDISKNLGISKKSLYKYFKDKDEIVSTLMQMDIDAELEMLDSLVQCSENAIEETYAFSKVLTEKLKAVNPSMIYDLEKYHPQAWKLFVTHKRVDIFDCIKSNLDRGIKEGFYQEQLNPEIVARIYSEKIDMLFNQELFPATKFKIENVYNEMIRYHLRGIVNDKGREYLKNRKLKKK